MRKLRALYSMRATAAEISDRYGRRVDSRTVERKCLELGLPLWRSGNATMIDEAGFAQILKFFAPADCVVPRKARSAKSA